MSSLRHWGAGTLLALSLVPALGAPASAQVVIGDNRKPAVEVDPTVLDRLGKTQTLPGMLLESGGQPDVAGSAAAPPGSASAPIILKRPSAKDERRDAGLEKGEQPAAHAKPVGKTAAGKPGKKEPAKAASSAAAKPPVVPSAAPADDPKPADRAKTTDTATSSDTAKPSPVPEPAAKPGQGAPAATAETAPPAPDASPKPASPPNATVNSAPTPAAKSTDLPSISLPAAPAPAPAVVPPEQPAAAGGKSATTGQSGATSDASSPTAGKDQPSSPAPQSANRTEEKIPPKSASAPPQTTPSASGDIPVSVLFDKDGARLPEAARQPLSRLVDRLSGDPSLQVQMLAYAYGDEDNASKARRLSLSRALAVRSYLIDQGVRSTRIEVRALGNKNPEGPADRVDILVQKR